MLIEHKLQGKDFIFVEMEKKTSKSKDTYANSEDFNPEDLSFLHVPFEDYATIEKSSGLSNLGNTCYMNAAIQNILHVKELSTYFLLGLHQREINHTNVMGSKGRVAEIYGDLAYDCWRPKLK
jgi:ubiquitin C-terminal hydrolase